MAATGPTSLASEWRPFQAGAIVLLSLHSPREKFWGVLLAIDPAGVSVRGIDLASFDETTSMIRHGETASCSTLFFPMHRVERVEIDSQIDGVPSLAQRFRETSGVDPMTFLRPTE